MHRIVVGLDGTDASRRALAWAVDDARRRGDARVEAAHAWDTPLLVGSPAGGVASLPPEGPYAAAAHALLEAALEGIDTSGVTVERVVLEGPAGSNLCQRAEGAALLVVGSSRHSALVDALLGSVTHYCVHHARCPVVVIPAVKKPK
jgi:nucleotide-binding universal stress UspA family protein